MKIDFGHISVRMEIYIPLFDSWLAQSCSFHISDQKYNSKSLVCVHVCELLLKFVIIGGQCVKLFQYLLFLISECHFKKDLIVIPLDASILVANIHNPIVWTETQPQRNPQSDNNSLSKIQSARPTLENAMPAYRSASVTFIICSSPPIWTVECNH